MRSFVVAAKEKGRQRRRDLRQVEAETAEHAILKVVASHPGHDQGGEYEAWPSAEPASSLRMTFGPRTG